MTTVKIREHRKSTVRHNPKSGHSWSEDGPVIHYEVVGAVGVHCKCKSLEKAQREKESLQAFYDKFGL